jgi:hypothetical protein
MVLFPNDELYPCEDAQEFFDQLGVLSNVLGESASVEEFLIKLKK